VPDKKLMEQAKKRFSVNYNAFENEPMVVTGSGGYYNREPMTKFNKKSGQIDKIA